MPNRRPNIVLIMTDQQRLDSIGIYGSRGSQTPHIDSLAQGGVVFENYYSSCPLCIPARSSIATGRYPHSNGAIINGFHPRGEDEFSVLNDDEKTIAEFLVEAGYRVGHIGVSHVRTKPPLPDKGIFDVFISNNDYSKYITERRLEKIDMSPHRHPCREDVCGEEIEILYSSPVPGRHPYNTEDFLDFFYARNAKEFVDRVPTDKPFALLCFLWAPHPPFVIPEPYYSMYSPKDIDPPPNLLAPLDNKPRIHLRYLPGQLGSLLDREGWLKTWAVYAGMVSLVDDCIGIVLEAIRRKGEWDNTVILFTTDHGEMLGSHSLFQKMVVYQEAIHLPFIVHAPDALAGRRAQFASHIDITPTILDYAGIPIPERVQGLSLRPVIEDQRAASRPAVFSEYNGGPCRGHYQRTVITNHYKYIYNPGDVTELYDLSNDTYEMENLSGNYKFAPVESELRNHLTDWMVETGDFLAQLY